MARGIPDYDELRIRIEPRPDGDFQVAAFGPYGSSAGGNFALPFDERDLDLFVLRVGVRKRGVRSAGSSHLAEVKRVGSTLFDALVKDDIRDLYLDACRAAELDDRGLRVTLHLTPQLMNVPWEYLYEEPRFLAQSIYTPVVRSLDLRTVRPPRRLTPPLRVLGVVSRPQQYDDLDADREQVNLEAALAPLRTAGLVDLHWLNRATLAELHRVISAPDEFHVLHCIGHGFYDDALEQGYLVFETAQGLPRHVSGEELGALLQDERSLRLVVLNSCEGARTSHADPFSGVASGILGYGVPAVIGMQFEITDEAAITFSDQLYSSLVQGFTVDAAVAQTRKAIYAEGHDAEFGTPVLYLRGHETRLFDVDDLAVEHRMPRDTEEDFAAPATVSEEGRTTPARESSDDRTSGRPAPATTGSAEQRRPFRPGRSTAVSAAASGGAQPKRRPGARAAARPGTVTAASVLWICLGSLTVLAGFGMLIDVPQGELAPALIGTFFFSVIGLSFIVPAVLMLYRSSPARTALTVLGAASLALILTAPLVIPALILQFHRTSKAWFEESEDDRAPPGGAHARS